MNVVMKKKINSCCCCERQKTASTQEANRGPHKNSIKLYQADIKQEEIEAKEINCRDAYESFSIEEERPELRFGSVFKFNTHGRVSRELESELGHPQAIKIY